jgi:hypothetical protein
MEEVRLESIHSGSTNADLEQRLARLRNQDLTGASAKPLPPTLESPSLPVGLDDAQEVSQPMPSPSLPMGLDLYVIFTFICRF